MPYDRGLVDEFEAAIDLLLKVFYVVSQTVLIPSNTKGYLFYFKMFNILDKMSEGVKEGLGRPRSEKILSCIVY